jgi:hypothetical protein
LWLRSRRNLKEVKGGEKITRRKRRMMRKKMGRGCEGGRGGGGRATEL